MINQLANAATYGFGASFGRDLYKSAKNNPIVWAIIGILLLVFGWRNLYMGVGRGVAYKFFVSFLGSLIMIALGISGFLIVGTAMDGGNGNGFMTIAIVLIIICTIIGNLWGMADRKKRIQEIEIVQHNTTYMYELGLTDSDFDSDLLQDQEGNLLKLQEQTDDKIVFSVSGKRGLRAAIKLKEGRMVDYTGIVKI